MGDFFTNYEIRRLDVIQPDVVNLLLIILFFSIVNLLFSIISKGQR